MIPPPVSRRAGVLVPLFSIPSASSWGIGEIGDLRHVAAWCRAAGCSMLQLLPVNEMPLEETSPYSALSAMAIDPQFISVSQVEDFEALGGEGALEPELQDRLVAVRRAPRVDYGTVRALKDLVLRRCFARFVSRELGTPSARADAFRVYVDAERWWLEDYALYRALHALHGSPWSEWPEPIRQRDPAALEAARVLLERDIAYRKYLQWVAGEQWRQARAACQDVRLFGDMPFMVSADSADVWARQDEFRHDVSVGVPPDAFSETGQDWKLPLYRWDVFAARDFDWLRHRARRYAALYDGYRVDHLVGFYRTYFRPHDGSPAAFSPEEQGEQEQLGERVLGVFLESGAEIIAEDLGVIPDFVRASLARLTMPGYKVFRWERQWHTAGEPFIDPVDYPPVSAATSGTHDTEPMVIWWEAASQDEREAVLAVPSIRARVTAEVAAAALTAPSLDPVVREALLESLFVAGSNYLILPIGDVFGWRDRINQPATVGPANWTWRLPWPSERLRVEPEALAVSVRLGSWSVRHGRALPTGELQ
ncbi:MAG: 4-alpha-glucanotransferase [Vicinamibacterales bacterium]